MELPSVMSIRIGVMLRETLGDPRIVVLDREREDVGGWRSRDRRVREELSRGALFQAGQAQSSRCNFGSSREGCLRRRLAQGVGWRRHSCQGRGKALRAEEHVRGRAIERGLPEREIDRGDGQEGDRKRNDPEASPEKSEVMVESGFRHVRPVPLGGGVSNPCDDAWSGPEPAGKGSLERGIVSE